MELKTYQRRTLQDLEDYIGVLNDSKSLGAAYSRYWMNRGVDLTAGSVGALRPYVNSVPGSPRVTLKVPTAGGKTFIAINAIGTIMDNLKTDAQNKVVVWFVPSDAILTQTLQKLQDATHPYRRRIDALFGHRVNVIDKRSALAAHGMSPTQLRDNLTILVLSAASFIETVRVKKGSGSEAEKPLAFRENGNFMEYAGSTRSDKIEGVADTALIQVLATLRPVVIVDESHNFTADLRVEMFQHLSPRFILELTATPRDNSNIISFVDAMELKIENMVKLPVIVENRRSTDDVIDSSIRMRDSLERHAQAMQQAGGRYIRPIVLFQAQPRNNNDSITFERIREKLSARGIAKEQIRIKTANKDELHGEDLMSPQCPVRYIITVNALKEGWDCPFAYILASLANRTSPVDVEQILGRVLRLPYTVKHADGLLNLSYVFTNSNEFQTTVNRIVESLVKCGFSRKDYREVTPLPNIEATHQAKETSFFDHPEYKNPPESVNADDNKKAIGSPSAQYGVAGKNAPNVQEVTDSDTLHTQLSALRQDEHYEQQIDERRQEVENDPLATMATKEMYNTFNTDYKDVASEMNLPMFYMKVQTPPDFFHIDVDEEGWTLLDKDMLSDDFHLTQQNADINFNVYRPEDTAIDIMKNGQDDYVPVRKNNVRLESIRREFIDLSATMQKDQLAERISREIAKNHNFDSIYQSDIKEYVKHVINIYNGDEIIALWDNFYQTTNVIEDKIADLLDAHREKMFIKGLATGKIEVRGHYTFLEKVTFAKQELMGIDKGLYAKEEAVNGLEQRVIQAVSDLDNVLFWHRNPEKGSGFCINGFINHYPDFIVRMKSGKTVLIETKGDHLNNEDSKRKRRLGKEWEAQCGHEYKYFMVFESIHVDGALTLNQLIDYLKDM